MKSKCINYYKKQRTKIVLSGFYFLSF